VIRAVVDGVSGVELRGMVDDLRNKLGSGIVLLAAVEDGRVSLALGVTPDLTEALEGRRPRARDRGRGRRQGRRPARLRAGGRQPARAARRRVRAARGAAARVSR
jgi:alanyl-tRNA synthetase